MEDTIIEAPFNTASISFHPAFDKSQMRRLNEKYCVFCVLGGSGDSEV